MHLVSWGDPHPPHEPMGETWEPRKNFQKPDVKGWYIEDPDFTNIKKYAKSSRKFSY